MSTEHQQPIPSQRTDSNHDPGQRRRFVDPEQLVCPGCGELPIRCEPPGYWRVADGLPVPQFSHQDATALCRGLDGTVSEPVEIEALT